MSPQKQYSLRMLWEFSEHMDWVVLISGMSPGPRLSHETTNLNKILRIQKKYCRIITFSKFNEHSRPLFVKLSILSVYDTYKYQLLIHVYKEIKNISPAGSQYYTENSA